MYVSATRANEISGAVFLIGLGVIFATGFWWPGIMFVLGVMMLVQGLVQGRAWYSMQGAAWMIGLGIWFAFGASIAVLFILLGVSALIGALIRPPMFAKPKVDNSLE